MNGKKILAGLAVFRTLYDSEKDIYEVIAAFLKEIIYENKLYSFSLENITQLLNSTYQFEIPIAVIGSSIKRIPFVERSNGSYIIKDSTQLESIIGSKELDIQTIHKSILSQLYDYIESETKQPLNDEEKIEAQSSFCNFILDNEVENKYITYITSFIIKNKSNEDFNNKLNIIREGVILHTGIRYNSDPSDRGSWKSSLVIFLDLEILFHLAGYNGEVYKEQAEELIGFIKDLNKKDPKISLQYFSETKDEIERFFRIGERIVKGLERINPRITAMVSITNGCISGSDVQCKKDDFYNLIENKYKITLDKYDKYYAEENYKYNIIDLEDSGIENSEYNSLNFLNYTAIRRKGNISNNFENIGYILLTGNSNTQRIASEKCVKGNVPLSTNLNFLTNKIWFKLNKGLSKQFPQSFSIISKSQIILSKIISDGVGEKYEELKKKVDSKEISEEQAKSRYQHLRTSIKRPEELDQNIVDEIFSFLDDDTEKYLAEQEYLKARNISLEKDKQKLEQLNIAKKERNDKVLASLKKQIEIKTNKLSQIKDKLKSANDECNIIKSEAECKAKKYTNLLAFVMAVLFAIPVVCFFIYKNDLFSFFDFNKEHEETIYYCMTVLVTLVYILIIWFTNKGYEKESNILAVRARVYNYFFRKFSRKSKEKADLIREWNLDLQELQSEISDLTKTMKDL